MSYFWNRDGKPVFGVHNRMDSNRLKRMNQHCLGSKRGLQRGGDDRAVLEGKGTGVLQAGTKGLLQAD